MALHFLLRFLLQRVLTESYYRNVGDDSWTKVATPFSSFYPQKLSNDGKYVHALTQLSEDINASQVLIKMASRNRGI